MAKAPGQSTGRSGLTGWKGRLMGIMTSTSKLLGLPVLVAAILALLPARIASSQEPNSVIPEDQVNRGSVESALCSEKGVRCSHEGEFLLLEEPDGFRVVAAVDEERKLISYVAILEMSSEIPEAEKLQLVNQLNDSLILVRFVMTTPTLLWCDYEIHYNQGIPAQLIRQSYQTFTEVVKGALQASEQSQVAAKTSF